MRSVSVALACIVLLIAGCLTPAAERRIGETEEAKLEQTVGLSDHAASSEWVEAVGMRVARHAPPGVNYRFHVIDMEEPNAFALPGGPVYISRGLLAFLNSEDELAGVLGHEIGHIADRHAARRHGVATPLAILLGLPAVILESIAPGFGKLATLPAAIAGSAAIASYSRKQEHAADRLGVDFAAAAGYEPGGLVGALQSLTREQALQENGAGGPSFFSSHPTTPDRVDRVREHARTRQPGARSLFAPDRAAVLSRLAGLMVGPHPKHGVFDGDRFLHPDLGFALRLPAEWKHVNTPEMVASLPSIERRDVFVTLRLAGEGDDPMDLFADQEFDEETRRRIERRRISGLPAAHLATAADGSVVDFTWLAYRGLIYMVTGVSPAASASRFAPVFRRVADSFAPLAAADRAAIREQRVAVEPAAPRESLASLVRRSGSVWDAAWVAAANAWPPNDPLPGGRPMKIAVERVYRGDPE